VRRPFPLSPETLEKLAGVGAEGLDVAPVALVVENIEGQRRLARPGHARHRRHRTDRDLDGDALEIVLAGPGDPDVAAIAQGEAQHDRQGGRAQAIASAPAMTPRFSRASAKPFQGRCERG
jgi:hypothetical protein